MGIGERFGLLRVFAIYFQGFREEGATYFAVEVGFSSRSLRRLNPQEKVARPRGIGEVAAKIEYSVSPEIH